MHACMYFDAFPYPPKEKCFIIFFSSDPVVPSVVLSTETVLIIARPLMCHLCLGTICLAPVGVGLSILATNWLKDL